MGIKISNLPAIVAPALTDVFPVVQSGVTYKETMAQLQTLLDTYQVVSSVIDSGSGVALTNGVTTNITSISLTPGDWEVFGSIGTSGTAGAITTRIVGAISTVSAVIPATMGLDTSYATSGTISILEGTGTNPTITFSPCILTLGVTTTVYLMTNNDFITQPMKGYGEIIALKRG